MGVHKTQSASVGSGHVSLTGWGEGKGLKALNETKVETVFEIGEDGEDGEDDDEGNDESKDAQPEEGEPAIVEDPWAQEEKRKKPPG